VPPLPPHIKLEQSHAYLSVLWKGDPNAAAMVRSYVRRFWPECEAANEMKPAAAIDAVEVQAIEQYRI